MEALSLLETVVFSCERCCSPLMPRTTMVIVLLGVEEIVLTFKLRLAPTQVYCYKYLDSVTYSNSSSTVYKGTCSWCIKFFVLQCIKQYFKGEVQGCWFVWVLFPILHGQESRV